MQHLLCHELKANIADYSLLISEEIVAKPHETKEAREKISEFFFERLNLANLYFLKSPVLSCFATGRSTALVLDSGDTFTRAVSVHDGFCLTKSAKWLPKGGRTISKEIGRFIETKLNKRLGSRYDLLHHSYSASFLSYHQN